MKEKTVKAVTAEGNVPQDLVAVTVQISVKDYEEMVEHFQNCFTGISLGRPLVAVHKILQRNELHDNTKLGKFWRNKKWIQLEPTWMLVDEIDEKKLDIRKIDNDTVLVKEIGGEHRQCELKIDSEGRLLFNGTDIETENFMMYLGIMDEVICVNEVLGHCPFSWLNLNKNRK
jgi:hypothetical protein